MVLLQKVDLSKLDMPALQRYIRHFNLVSQKEQSLFFYSLRVFVFLQDV